MKDKKLTLYDKNKIIELVSNMLKYYDKSKYKKVVIKASHLLMDKVRYSDGEDITLEADFIEEILFVFNDDGTKSIVRDVYHLLRSIDADLINVSFDNVHISGFSFNGLRNVEIDIQKIPNYDISRTNLNGVKVKGTLDGANVEVTNFTGYIGDLVLNPQLVQNKSLFCTNINGLTVNGSFDDVNVSCMKTKGHKGEIIINPQRVLDKDLWCIDFNNIKLVGNYDENSGTYDDACFEGCRLYGTSFKGCIGNVVIPLDKLYYDVISLCNFTGVKLTGARNNVDLTSSFYEDENGKKIYLTDNKDNSEDKEENNTYKNKSKIRSIFDKIIKISEK